MSASWHLAPRPDFTRLAPYRLAAETVQLALPEAEYRVSMLCRLAGQRGLPLPSDVTTARVLGYHSAAINWMRRIRDTLDRKLSNE